MEKRLRQISDTIHQTVYLSELESKLMSTAYFYRLHDVYQSSTVYLTFPSNRTKRYEHSYGTMELAGEMFFAAITNANNTVNGKKTLDDFFTVAETYLQGVVEKLLEGQVFPTYCNKSKKSLEDCFAPVKRSNLPSMVKKAIENASKNFEPIEDIALNHYMPPFSTGTSTNAEIGKRRFLYQCLLEAVRIVALFHDVGHPPYSHITEQVLDELYSSSKNAESPTVRMERLVESLQPFKNAEDDNILCLLSTPREVRQDLHEQVGLKMLAGAFESIFQEVFNDSLKNTVPERDMRGVLATYYVSVAEFCFAILREQSNFFKSLHRIVDGCVDADRMDYIMRDSLNSAVDWGTIPYKRILESCMMIEQEDLKSGSKDNFYLIAYPRKMAEHIDDLLITRYKIFSRINYHHRSYKTSLIFQQLIKLLAEDYLRKSDSDMSICPGISDLWECLVSTLNSGALDIIQWNDSTIISHLYQALVDVKSHSYGDYNIAKEEFDRISNMLDEFLLNHKHYYSVFKRQSDLRPIFEEVFQKIEPQIEIVKDYERKKYENESSLGKEPASADAEDSLKRLNSKFLENMIHSADGDTLIRIFPIDLESIIRGVLVNYKEEDKINAFLFSENKKRSRTGLPHLDDDSDAIYLYESDSHDITRYDTSVLESQLVQLQNYCLQYIAYIEPKSGTDSSAVIQEIRNTICEQIVEAVIARMESLFSCLH